MNSMPATKLQILRSCIFRARAPASKKSRTTTRSLPTSESPDKSTTETRSDDLRQGNEGSYSRRKKCHVAAPFRKVDFDGHRVLALLSAGSVLSVQRPNANTGTEGDQENLYSAD